MLDKGKVLKLIGGPFVDHALIDQRLVLSDFFVRNSREVNRYELAWRRGGMNKKRGERELSSISRIGYVKALVKFRYDEQLGNAKFFLRDSLRLST